MPNYTNEKLLLLIDIFQQNNLLYNITGILLYNEGNVIQYIEGNKDNVVKLFNNILYDNRHIRIIKLLQNQINIRNFPNWSMSLFDFNNNNIYKTYFNNFMNISYNINLTNDKKINTLLLLFKQLSLGNIQL
jgi:uncharacterized membrane protein